MLWGEVGDIVCFTAETCTGKAAGVFDYEKGGALPRNHHVLDARKDGNEAALTRQPKGQAFTHRALAYYPVDIFTIANGRSLWRGPVWAAENCGSDSVTHNAVCEESAGGVPQAGI